MALVISILHLGGAERVISHLANHWAGRGDTVHLVMLAGADQPQYYHIAPEVRLHHLNLMGRSRGLLDAMSANIRRIGHLREVLNDVDLDVLISFITTSNVLATIAARSLRVPVIISERSSTVDARLALPWRLARRACYRFADGIVFQTERARAAFTGAAPARSVVIANPVPLPAEPCAADSAEVITAAGRLVPEKGFDLLLEAFAMVAARHPGWRLEIWGDGPERRNLESLRDKLGLRSRVRLPGTTAEPGAWTRSGAVFVLSSRYEGFPNALCEAMAAGHAVVATDCRFGPREVVTHDQDGLLTSPGDAGALAAALDRLLGDKALRQRLAAAARCSIRRFDMPAVISQWDDLIRSVAVRG
jgi:glycosyltransferase involved in cell wall biosynthesis